MGVGNILLASKNCIVKNRRTILTIAEIGSFAYGVYRAYKDAPRFKAIMEEIKDPEVPTKAKVKDFVVVSAPVIGAAVVNVTAAVCNQKIASKEITQLGDNLASVTTALNISQSLKAATENKAREILGDEAVDKVHEAVLADKTIVHKGREMNNEGTVLISKPNDYYDTGNGRELIYDEWSDTFFYSNIDKVKSGLAAMVIQMANLRDGSASLSQYYEALGLPSDTGAPMKHAYQYVNPNDAIGWSIYGPDNIRGYEDIISIYSGLNDGDHSFAGIHFVTEPRHLSGKVYR